MNKPKYDPAAKKNKLAVPPWDQIEKESDQLTLIKEEKKSRREDS